MLSMQLLRHEERTHRAFFVGDLVCVEELKISHMLFRRPRWHMERRQLELPADEDSVPPCVKLHGLLPAPQLPAVITHEPALVYKANVVATVWTDGSGKHSSDPHHRRRGVAYYTDTQERVWIPLPGINVP
eukprot:4914041-Amphidinium_carterae.3